MSFSDVGRYSAKNTERTATFATFDGGIKLGDRWGSSENIFMYTENLLCENGALGSRKGQIRCAQSLGESHSSAVFGDELYLHCGSSLFKWDGNLMEEPSRVCFLGSGRSMMFVFGGRLYIMEENSYSVCDGTSVSAVTPYVPTVIVGRGRGTSDGNVHEALNMIGRGFETWFNFEGDGVYYLPYDDLASDDVTVLLNGTDVSSACAIDRAAGTVTVSGSSESEQGINNLRVTAYLKESAISEDRSKILNCRIHEIFGGTDGSGTRILISGNPDYPTHVFRSGLLDPTYFPDTDFELVGFADDRITAMKKQYGELMVLCEKSIHAVSYLFTDGEVIFSSRTVNAEIGCDMPNSVQLINNNTVFGNSKRGIFMICSAVSENENNVVPLSANVNLSDKGILRQNKDKLKAAYSADYDGKYWLFVDSRCYVWDYGVRSYPVGTSNFSKAQKNLCWFMQSNMRAIRPICYDGGLFYSHPNGSYVKYGEGYKDFDEDIPRMAEIAPNNFGYPSREKKIHDISTVFDVYGQVNIKLKFYRNGDASGSDSELCELNEVGGFNGNTLTVNAAVAVSRAYSFSVRIEISGARFTLRRLDLKYRL